MSSFRRIFKYYWLSARKYRWYFYLMFFVYGIGIVLASTIIPFIVKELIDSISVSSPSALLGEKLFNLVFLFAMVNLGYFVAFRLGDYLMIIAKTNSMRNIHNDIFRRLMYHSYGFYVNNFTGSLVAKAKRFTAAFRRIYNTFTFDFFWSGLTFLSIFIVLFTQIPTIALGFLGWVIIYIFITFLFLRKKLKYDIALSAADSKITGTFADVITNILNLKIFSSRHREYKSFNEVTTDELHKRFKTSYFDLFQNVVKDLLMGGLNIVVLYFLVKFWLAGSITAGIVVLVQTYMFIIFDRLWNLGKALTGFVTDVSEAKEMADIFDKVPDILDPEKPKELIEGDGEIEFKDVDFEYVEDLTVFEDFNLKLKAGEKVGLVGHSGSGKSTITKMLLRFADVKDGAILIDGQDIRSVTQDDLRSKISYVPQDPILFHRGIGENIGYSKPGASQEEIVEAAKKAHAHEFISALPKGYDTLVGERGVKLSGGERQRVAIARAMLKDSPILVLDEATSSLDSKSESYIQEAFGELMKGKTTLVIAHRLSTIQQMDRIVVLDKGKITEEGTHKELLERGGIYRDLWDHQTGGFLEE